MIPIISNLRNGRPLVNCGWSFFKISSGSQTFSALRNTMAVISDLCRIDVKADDPFVLFKEWQEEAATFSNGMPGALCLATVSKDGQVSARHLLLRRLDDDGFVLMSDKRSRKARDLEEIPSAAMCFHWAYEKDNGDHISRQVRVQGIVRELEKKDYHELYEKEPVVCKIRAHLCHQGKEVDWEELKNFHDQLLRDYEDGLNTLPMPDHVVGYKLTPSSMEFYYARKQLIADRVLFKKDSPTGNWKHRHLAA